MPTGSVQTRYPSQLDSDSVTLSQIWGGISLRLGNWLESRNLNSLKAPYRSEIVNRSEKRWIDAVSKTFHWQLVQIGQFQDRARHRLLLLMLFINSELWFKQQFGNAICKIVGSGQYRSWHWNLVFENAMQHLKKIAVPRPFSFSG